MAAKEIQISDDSGVSWETLPGSTGEFNEEAEGITDTIFGQTYQSTEVGLISWTISANALFKGFAGYQAKVKKTGSTTAFTGEATTDLTGNLYQITDTTKRIWDRTVTLVVNDNGSPISDADITWVDYLFGRVQLDGGYTPTGAITFDGNYFPTSDLGTTSSFTLTQTAETIDKTDFATAQGNGGVRVFDPGLKTVSLDLTGFYDVSNAFSTTLTNRQEVIIEINPDGGGNSVARGFFKPGTHGQSGDVGALEEETITFNLTVPVQNKLQFVFDWEHGGSSTIPEAVKILLEAFINETKPDVRYLPTGVATEGKEGTVVVTDVSLESSLDGMNTFTANFQGSGAYTELT